MTEKERAIIRVFARCNMNIQRTAKALGCCRRTVNYQLKGIKEKYNLNPKKFHDLKKLIEYIKHGEKNSFVFGFFYDVDENDLIEIKIRAENEDEAWNKLNEILSESATMNRTIYPKDDYKKIEKGTEKDVT